MGLTTSHMDGLPSVAAITSAVKENHNLLIFSSFGMFGELMYFIMSLDGLKDQYNYNLQKAIHFSFI